MSNSSNVESVITESDADLIYGSQLDILYKVSTGLQVFSILTSSSILLVYFVARKYTPELVKRVTFQLTVAVSVVEGLYGAAQLFSTLYTVDDFFCKLGVFFYVFFSLWSTLLSMCIAINLQLVFIYNQRRDHVLIIYVLSSFLISLALTIVPLFLGIYGYDEKDETCWYLLVHGNDQRFNVYAWATFYFPTLISIIYSAYASISVMLKLKRAQRLNNNLLKNESSGKAPNSKALKSNKDNAEKVIHQLVSRLIYYPLIPFAGQIFNIVSDAVFGFSGESPFWILTLSYLGTSLQGVATVLLFFCIDPAWSHLKRELKKKIWPNEVFNSSSITLSNCGETSTSTPPTFFNKEEVAKFV
ncbi:hypothetical protein HDU92_000986 [Lobulomyces angularis]|nr:hypothetical protein HDU92_000986 [Lobulomyces angularis]